ncbi:MAG: ABC transporter permease, partial [Bryobacterales bacterium]|nr:ABC transporter permease [Bryobacterales bacterium]
VLSAVAAAAGIGIAELALRYAAGATMALAAELPFWVSFHLSWEAVLYAGALSVLAAAIVGVAPGLQATKRDLHAGLKQTGGGRSGMRLGATWTALIVAQVGFAVALLPAAVAGASADLRSGFADLGFAAERFLSAQVAMESPEESRFAARQDELTRRLQNEARVSGVTFAMANPGEERPARIEIQGERSESREARVNRVDVGFFREFAVPILAGRDFVAEDAALAGESGVVVVNDSFARNAFGGDPLGRRVRYAAGAGQEPGRWFEVVGVVSDFPTGASPGLDDSPLKLYHPAPVGAVGPVTLLLHVRDGQASSFAGRLREIAGAVDPELSLREVVPLDAALRREQWIRRMEASALGAVTLSVLMLSTAGIYSLMSITVSQRRKEIGIRMALGADRFGIVAGILGRALGQLGAGAAVGAALAIALERSAPGGLMRGQAAIVVPGVALFLMAAGLAAALGPAKRCLAIEPTEALRDH